MQWPERIVQVPTANFIRGLHCHSTEECQGLEQTLAALAQQKQPGEKISEESIMESLEKILTDKEFAGGLPKGDTVLVIAEIKAEPSEFTDNQGRKKTRYKLAFPDGKEYFVPVSLMRDLQREARAGKKKVRITRTGEGMDTRYAALGIDG